MKILVVASPWLGGSGSVGYELSRALADIGHEVIFLSYDFPFKGEADNPRWRFKKVEPYTYPLFPFPIYELALAEQIAETVKQEGIDIIHAHYGILFGHAAMMAKQSLASQGIPVRLVTTFHGSDVIGFDLQEPGSIAPVNMNRGLIQASDAVTVASDNLRQWLSELYGLKSAYVIPNFIDIEHWKRAHGHTLTKPVHIVHISNFRKVKRPLKVLEIFEAVAQQIQCTLTFIGDGPERQKAEKYVREHNLKESVTFFDPAPSEELVRHLQTAHIFLLPSIYENFPLTALEAQACGVPVVASAVGGFPSVVNHAASGFLIHPDDTEGFVQSILALGTDSVKWQAFSDTACSQVAQFSKPEVVFRYVSLFELLLKKDSGA